MKLLKNITLVLAVFLWCCACDHPGEGNLRGEIATAELLRSDDGDQSVLKITFDSNFEGYFETCTNWFRIFKVDDKTQERIILADIDSSDEWNGYYLDGEFMNPIQGLGCDVLDCSPISNRSFSHDLVEFEKTGVKVLSDEEKAALVPAYEMTLFQREVPDVLTEYITVPLEQGTLEVEIDYTATDECHTSNMTTEVIARIRL